MNSVGTAQTAAPSAARLPRVVKLFGFVSLLNDFASEMVYPLLPAFVTGVLGAGAGALGALDGAAEFASAIVKYVAGRLADRPARRGRLVVLGYLAAVLVRPVIAFVGAAWQVIGLRVVDRLGKGLRTPPRDALIADATPVALRGRAFGLQRGLDHAGAVLGPLAAWWLLSFRASDLRHIIAASIVPGVAVFLLAVWAVRDGARRGMTGKDGEAGQDPTPSSPVAPRRSPPLALYAISFFYLLRMPEMLVILRSQELGVSVASVLLLWAALHVVRSSSSFVGGGLSDRIGPARTMWLGWAAYAGIAVGFAVARGAVQAWVLFLVLGVVAGLTESPERALVARLAGGRQGSGFGAYHAVTGLAALAGGVGLGAVFQGYGATPAFLVSAAGGLALALAWPVLMKLKNGVDGV
jgi:MFS family permease